MHDIVRHKDNHVVEGAKIIENLGYPEVAKVMRKHRLFKLDNGAIQPKTIEEKIVFYADKRVKNTLVVSLKERYDDVRKRYDGDFSKEFKFGKNVEKELIGHGKGLL